jgi:uncharacterized protein YkwD
MIRHVLSLAVFGGIALSPVGFTGSSLCSATAGPRPALLEWVRFPPTHVEVWVFEEINRERVRRGMRPLVWDELLAEIAREHSRDMAARQFFGHITPEGRDVEARLRPRGITRYRMVAENLALIFDPISPVSTTIHQWMMSPGHKRNILGPFRYTGVGVAISARGAYYITQVFLDR